MVPWSANSSSLCCFHPTIKIRKGRRKSSYHHLFVLMMVMTLFAKSRMERRETFVVVAVAASTLGDSTVAATRRFPGRGQRKTRLCFIPGVQHCDCRFVQQQKQQQRRRMRWLLPRQQLPTSLLSSKLKKNWFQEPLIVRFLSLSSNVVISSEGGGGTAETKLLSREEQQQYESLKATSNEIRRHDDLYYIQSCPEIGDDEYDALVKRESQICLRLPNLVQRWQIESGLGIQATRFGGRVGAIVIVGEDKEENVTTTTTEISSNDINVAGAAVPPSIVERPFIESLQPPLKRNHLTPMLSLDNANTERELLDWLGRIRKKIILHNLNDKNQLFATTRLVEEAPREKSEDARKEMGDPFSYIEILTEPKLDGLSLSLRYEKKEDDRNSTNQRYNLVWASTRGDGKRGQDVSKTVVERMGLPTELIWPNNYYCQQEDSSFDQEEVDSFSIPTALEIRGEVVLPNSVFHDFNRARSLERDIDGNNNNSTTSSNTTTTTSPFSNARNAASGIIMRKYNDGGDNQKNDTEIDEELKKLHSSLRFYPYDIVFDPPPQILERAFLFDDNNKNKKNKITTTIRRQLLECFGFKLPSPVICTILPVDNETEWDIDAVKPMLEYHAALRRHRIDDDSGIMVKNDYVWGDYDMDGCVHKVTDHSLRWLLGASNRAPRWAIAHKFPPETVVTSLLQIDVQVGRTGALTPVAILEPTNLAGVTIQRATLHNFAHMQSIFGDTTKIAKGTEVLVRRAGDVIPQVVKLAASAEVFPDDQQNNEMEEQDCIEWISLSSPTHCPACGSDVIVTSADSSADAGGSRNSSSRCSENITTAAAAVGPILRCSSAHLLCPPRAVAALVHAFSRNALDVPGLSEARIQQLVDANMLSFPSDLFEHVALNMTTAPTTNESLSFEEELTSLSGWGKKSARNLVTVLTRVSREGATLTRFIYCLGIRGCGIHSSSLIASVYGNVDSFLSAVVECYSSSTDGEGETENSGASNSTTIERSGVPDNKNSNNAAFCALREDNNENTKGIGPVMLSSLITFSKQRQLVEGAQKLAKSIRVHNEITKNQQQQQKGKKKAIDSSFKDLDNEEIANQSTVTETNLDLFPLEGMKVVFTGKISPNLSRRDTQIMAKEMGAKATPNSISKETDLVVAGEKSGGKKLMDAKSKGVKVMDATEFLRLREQFGTGRD